MACYHYSFIVTTGMQQFFKLKPVKTIAPPWITSVNSVAQRKYHRPGAKESTRLKRAQVRAYTAYVQYGFRVYNMSAHCHDPIARRLEKQNLTQSLFPRGPLL